MLLSAIAAATERLRLVAGAIISPLRHPLAMAKDLATLDRLSRGRLVVLPTVSWHRDEYEALGVPFGRRGDILDEQLEIWSRAWAGSPVAFDGRHYRFGRVWLEPQPFRPGGPPLWFGGSSVHPRLIGRLVRYGSGFNPLGQPDDAGLARLAAAMTAAGRSPGELEYVGGIRGTFTGPDGPADLDQALAGIPPQLARGFRTICVKPSQFTDDPARIGDFCRELVAKVWRWLDLTRAGAGPGEPGHRSFVSDTIPALRSRIAPGGARDEDRRLRSHTPAGLHRAPGVDHLRPGRQRTDTRDTGPGSARTRR